MIPLNAYGDTQIKSNTPVIAFNISMDGREFLQEGYLNKADWENIYNNKKQEVNTLLNELNELKKYLTEDKQAILNNFNIENFKYISELDNAKNDLSIMKDEALAAKEKQLQQQRAKEQQQSVSQQKQQSSSQNSNNFKSQGVINWNGIRYTYYSSRVLYHYKTSEWTVGNDGIYRDNNGYIIVASSDYSYGSIVSTPFGQGKVYDSGCASGTIDIYTNF